jgi:hypothetical protein
MGNNLRLMGQHLARTRQEFTDEVQICFGIRIHQPICGCGEIGKKGDHAVSFASELYQYAPPISGVRTTPHIAGLRKAVHGNGQRPSGEADGVGQTAGRNWTRTCQVIQTAQVRAVHREVLRNGGVEQVARRG